MPAAEGPAYDLDCVQCGQPNLVLPGVAAFTGTHVVHYCYAGTVVCIEFEGVEGAPLMVPIGNLGAPYTYTFHVEQPDDEGPYTTTIDGTAFQRFRFCLKTGLVGEAVMIDAEGLTCENLTDADKGLSATQRVACILPTYTLAEFMAGLTDPQKAALIGWLCTTCPSMCAQIAEGSNAAVVACLSATPGRIEEIKALICDACASLCTLLGTVEDATAEVLPCLGSDQLLQLRVQVRRTDGGAILYFVAAAGALDLDPVLVTVIQADGSSVEVSHDVLGLNANRIAIGLTIPRFEVFTSDGVTPYATRDINAPTLTLPLQPVKNSQGSTVSTHEVGVDGEAPNAMLNLTDSIGTPIFSGVSLAAGVTSTAVAPDGSAVLKDTAGATLSTNPVRSNASAIIIAPDGTVLTTDGVTTIGVVKSGGTYRVPQSRIKYTAADGAAQVTAAADTEYTALTMRPATLVPRRPLKNSAGTTVGGSQIDLAQLIADTVPTAPDATVKTTDGVTTVMAAPSGANTSLPQARIKYTDAAGSAQVTAAADSEFASGTLRPATTIPRRQMKNTAGTPIGASQIDAGQLIADTVPVAPDSVITKPDATTANLAATVALDVRNYRSGIAYNFGKMLWSGQTTAHRTGDEGSILAGGFFAYTPPVYPLAYAELGANFSTMAANNTHGNTLRFTKRDGTAAATSGNRTIQDHLTGLEWYIPNALPTADTWNNAIDAAEASTVDSSTDWHLPNDRMIDSITDDSLNTVLNYAPFSISADLWTATTVPAVANTNARRLANSGGSIAGQAKTLLNAYIFCRRFI